MIRKPSASILIVGWRSTNSLIGRARNIIDEYRDDDRRDHDLDFLDEADGGDHRVEREHDVDEADLAMTTATNLDRSLTFCPMLSAAF